jgi:hypothetical protein
MAEIVFLNMSDELHVDGHKAVVALRNKHPAIKEGLSTTKEQVIEVQTVPIYRAWKTGAPLVEEMAEIKREVSSARKVMLSVHGPLKEVDHALIRHPQGVPGEKVSYQDLGGFLLLVLDENTQHNFTLVTCFAARTLNYRQPHLDERDNSAITVGIDWRDSFAYKLFNELCPARKVRMTARTGELSFNTVTGRSEVQTELSIQGTLDNEAIQAEEGVAESQKWWNTNVGRLMQREQPNPFRDFAINLTKATNHPRPADKLQALRQLQANPNLSTQDPDTPLCVRYLNNLVRLTEASARQRDPVKGKYGKIVYRYVPTVGICVFSKYPVPALLYPEAKQVDATELRKYQK